MKISYQQFPENDRYKSKLVINSESQWGETLYFTFYTPHGEKEVRIFAGRHKSGVHFKNKKCDCVVVFDFHMWDARTATEAMSLEMPEVSFTTPLEEFFSKALEERNKAETGFEIKVKDEKSK